MRDQQGAITLLITALLLVAILVLSLASYKNVFFQAKRAQNEVISRQQHWVAEGGLECAFTINRLNTGVGLLDQDYSDCIQSSLEFAPNTSGSTFYTITSKNVNSEVKKIIKISSRIAGAIQSRSDLKLIGAYQFNPDALLSGECISVRFSANFILEGAFVTNDPIDNGPFMGYSGACNPNTKTHTANDSDNSWDIDVLVTPTDTSSIAATGPLREDFIYDPTLDPFESFFGDERSNLASIRNKFEVINGSVSTTLGNQCEDLIASAFLTTDKVWVEGNCDIINPATLPGASDTRPKVIVVENGILTVNGSSTFNGFVYHLYSEVIPSDMTSTWDSLRVASTANLTASDKKTAVFQNNGSFSPTGGFVLDTPGGLSIFRSGMNLNFDSAAIPSLTNKIKWLKGSWHDF